MEQEMSLQACIDDCASCHAACTQAVQYCLERGGKHADPQHIRLMLDCAEICATGADFMLRRSDLHPYVCGVCAQVCTECAVSCERIGGNDDTQLRECARTCRRCAQSCFEMSKYGRRSGAGEAGGASAGH